MRFEISLPEFLDFILFGTTIFKSLGTFSANPLDQKRVDWWLGDFEPLSSEVGHHPELRHDLRNALFSEESAGRPSSAAWGAGGAIWLDSFWGPLVDIFVGISGGSPIAIDQS